MPLPDLADAAAEAFTEGWALRCAGEFTEAQLHAAVTSALGHADDPGILEVTLKIGSLAGAWKTVFDRREALTKKHTAEVLAAWQAITKRLGARQAVRLFRMHMRQHSGPDGRNAGILAALGFLYGVLVAKGYQALEDAVTDAIRAGQAEGKADALAVAAEQHPDIPDAAGFGWEKAYKAFYDQLADLPSLPLTAQAWVQKMIAGNASDLGGALGKLAEDGASEDEMVSAVEDITSGAVRAVSLFTDWAIGQAMSAASLSLYGQEGASLVNFITAGDSRVCLQCSDAEDNSPYPLDDAPIPGLHPLCRCVLDSADPLPLSAFTDFLSGVS